MHGLRETSMSLRQANIVYTDQKSVDLLYDLLEHFHETARRNGLFYVIAAGTLLGAVRHSGMIPWDTDADIVIQDVDAHVLTPLESDDFYLIQWWGGFKLCSRRGRPIDYEGQLAHPLFGLKPVTFPYVDLYPTVAGADGMFRYKSERAADMWPQEAFPLGAFDHIVEVPFGPISLDSVVPEQAWRYLEAVYGPEWKSSIVKTYDHETDAYLKGERVPLTDFSCAAPNRV
ncbi:hypothetical protein EXN70_31705 [Rhizobium rhizogenes]|nr:LicD family protein [Rhizobium rhizogenes]QCO89373.1 licD family protein [Rhizobium rhizogenes]TRB17077.1 hypothetical protein EXN70_31705 [Rhizobium rhizogenes]